LLDSLIPARAQRPIQEALRTVTVDLQVIQEFRPLARCLEWDLANLYWTTKGLLPFVDNEVPYLINNSGRASEDAALVLCANCLDGAPRAGPIRVLELGAGSGLFARYVLDAFRSVCQQEGYDYYERLTYFVSDHSPQTVKQWQERDLFAEHAVHVHTGTCDAQHPAVFRDLADITLSLTALQAVFANYVLDVLPAAIVHAGASGPEQLCVRTHLMQHQALLRQYTALGLEEVRALAASEDPAQRARLIPLLTLLEFETAFLPVMEDRPAYLEEALTFGKDLHRITLNHGALDSLEECLRLLAPTGFILFSDYGPVEREGLADHAMTQRFGSSTALGINFPFLEYHFANAGRVLLKAEGDKSQPIHTRLLCRDDLPRTRAALANRYSDTSREHFEAPAAEARRHVAAGRLNEALESYRTALTRNPGNWCLIGECAEFVTLQIRDYQAGLELTRAALELNASCSAWLWNVLGDGLFCLERFDQAHEAYLQARRISPDDVRTNFNLAYTHFQRGCPDEALEAIAQGLARDFSGVYRERLLGKQQQILTALSGRWLGEQERLLKRASVFA
jgi:tetratricopeptide (TPR) repeat protein